MEYDLMGINPDKNKGAYNFKKVRGAKHIEYLGEWERSINYILNKSINVAMKYKLV